MTRSPLSKSKADGLRSQPARASQTDSLQQGRQGRALSRREQPQLLSEEIRADFRSFRDSQLRTVLFTMRRTIIASAVILI